MRYLITLFTFLFSASLFSQTLNPPPRQTASPNGTQIISILTPLTLTAREDTIFAQVISGNIPDLMRNMVLVKDTELVSSVSTIVEYYVIPDYLALGCDTDYFLCPMTPLLAQRIANYTGTSMPTRKMVNQIWSQAPCHLAPQPISPSPQMTTVPVFADHNVMVWTSRSAQLTTHPLGTLTGGDKKDVVISNIIYGYPSPGRVVIYGWHQLNGSPIQPLYNGHEETYADYSHGIRLVQNDILVNGSASTIQDVLTSSTQNVLLSDEGVISVPNYPVSVPSLSVPTSFCVLDSASGIIKIKVKPDALVAGYNVMLSHDGLTFETPLYYPGLSFAITGLTPDTLIYLKLSAVGVSGGNSLYSEVLGATDLGATVLPKWLVVNGFDRPTSGNTFDFIRQHASAITNTFTGMMALSSATNEAVCDSLILLTDFMAVDYILGEESSANETFSDEEQTILSLSGTPLFVSGSEIGWDLDHLGSISDKAFYNNYLLASYVEDAPNGLASTYYQITSPEIGTDLYFDDGTHGTYDVRYPDVIQPFSASSSFSASYFTGFPSKYANVFQVIRLVYLSVPFETIYPESVRQQYFDWVTGMLFWTDNTNIKIGSSLNVFPNPSDGNFTIELPGDNSNAKITITDISGKQVNIKKTGSAENRQSFYIEEDGLYFLTIVTNGTKQTEKIVVIK